MREITRKQIMLALEGDPEATQAERNAITAALDNRNTTSTGTELDQVLDPQRVATLFGKSRKWVDWAAKQEGTLLRRVYLGGTRSAGFSAASVKAALEAATSPEAQARAAVSAKAARAKAAATIAARKAEEVAA